MMTRHAAGVVALGLALAACSPSADRNEASPAPANEGSPADGNAEDTAPADNAAQPSRSVLRPEVVEPEPGPEVVILQPFEVVVPFGSSGLKLDDAGRQALDRAAASPAAIAGGRITLSGHSDSRGNDGDNRVTSRIRAEAVRDYLAQKGIAPARFILIALGEARPAVPNARADGSDDPEGRATNRRVEVRIDLPMPTPPPVPGAAATNAAAADPA